MTTPTPTGSAPDDGSFRPAASIPTEQTVKPASFTERLEAAEVGSRELDALIWLRFNRPEYTGGVKALEMRGWYDGRGHLILETDAGEEVADDLHIGHFTTSLDAALALAERVLPGRWIRSIDEWPTRTSQEAAQGIPHWGPDYWRVIFTEYDGKFRQLSGYGLKPSLAICAAILKSTGEPR